MNQMEKDYLIARGIALEISALLMKLVVIGLCVFMGLWTLGLIIMYWYVIVPAFVIFAWWVSSHSPSQQAVSEPSSGGSSSSGER